MRNMLLGVTVFSLLLGSWSLMSGMLAMPLDAAAAAHAARTGSPWAARVALVRGDLWASDALAHLSVDVSGNVTPPQNAIERAKVAKETEDALALAPLRSDLWLLLSALRPTPAMAADDDVLQMAYLVGGGKREELHSRLARAVQSPALQSDSLRTFVQTDIAIALGKMPKAREFLQATYTSIPPVNRPVFIAMVKATDPDAASRLATSR